MGAEVAAASFEETDLADRGAWNATKLAALFALELMGRRYIIGQGHLEAALGVRLGGSLARWVRWRYVACEPARVNNRPAYRYRLGSRGREWLGAMLGPAGNYYSQRATELLGRVLAYVNTLDAGTVVQGVKLLQLANEMRLKAGLLPWHLPDLGAAEAEGAEKAVETKQI